MPYNVGEKGSHGCSGYPAVKTKTGEVMGCHETKEQAVAQIQAIAISEHQKSIDKDMGGAMPEGDTTPAGMKNPDQCTPDSKNCGMDTCKVCAKKSIDTEYNNSVDFGNAKVSTSSETVTYKNDCCPDEDMSKGDPCWEGYTQRGMKPGENGRMVPNCVPVAKANDLWEDSDDVVYESYSMEKAEGYSPPAGARSAARRAIKFKEDGKANGAGTAVGWTRAGQLSRGETISLSTVKRMYSYFSRHEVDKKGKDWGNTANPSNGYIMWLAWGGDAGFSWSRAIVNREMDKAIFADFGKDFTKVDKLTHIFND